ncbi:MAG: SRPBCC family protein [Gammaproteobacteria bacterium]|nr:SRPBCC family protein [Gammaproteobacteria bacterium]
MEVSTAIDINAKPQQVWAAISNIEQAAEMISAIKSITVLEQPTTGIVGLKWSETRVMFGKEATEVMWITEAQEPNYYQTCAQSHGSIYISRLTIDSTPEGSRLTFSFTGQPQTWLAKILSMLMKPLIRKSMIQALNNDLADIKHFVENIES